MSDSAAFAAATHLLEISGIVQSALCGLFGVYFSLFVLALWATHGRYDIPTRRLRLVTIVLFVDLCAHFIARSLQFDRSRILQPSNREFFKWSIPLIVIGNVTTTFAGLCSDGLLAWRFYVLYDRKKWALYIPGTFVVINAFLCWSADAQHLAAYHHYNEYENTLLEVTLQITVAWGWLMFAINTLLTGAILGKIIYTTKRSAAVSTKSKKYETVVRACIESAMVTWVGLLLYEICSLAPNGHVVTNYDVGYVMACIIPVFFGISQCLIVVRVALTNEISSRTAAGTSALQLESGSTNPSSRRPKECSKAGTDPQDITMNSFNTENNYKMYEASFGGNPGNPFGEEHILNLAPHC